MIISVLTRFWKKLRSDPNHRYEYFLVKDFDDLSSAFEFFFFSCKSSIRKLYSYGFFCCV